MSARAFGGWPTDSMVVTRNRGVVLLNDVGVGDEVWTHRGRWRPVVQVVDLGACSTVLATVANLGRVRVCPDQQLLVCPTTKPLGRRREWGKLTWARVADERAPEEELSFASRADFTSTSLVPAMQRGPGERYKSICPTDSLDFLWAAGRYVAGGCLTRRGPGKAPARVVWTIGAAKERDVTRLQCLPIQVMVQAHSSGSALMVTVSSMAMARWMRENCGEGATEKQVPPWVFGLPGAKRAAFLYGYLDGDGTRMDGFVTASTVSRRLAVGLSALAESLDYVCHVSEHPPSKRVFGNQTYLGRGFWTLRAAERARCHAGRLDSFTLRRRRDSRPAGPAPVLSLRVAEDRSFTVSGLLSADVDGTPGLPLL